MYVPCTTWLYVKDDERGLSVQESGGPRRYDTLEHCQPGDFYQPPSTMWYYMGDDGKWIAIGRNVVQWENHRYDSSQRRWYRLVPDPKPQPETYGDW